MFTPPAAFPVSWVRAYPAAPATYPATYQGANRSRRDLPLFLAWITRIPWRHSTSQSDSGILGKAYKDPTVFLRSIEDYFVNECIPEVHKIITAVSSLKKGCSTMVGGLPSPKFRLGTV